MTVLFLIISIALSLAMVRPVCLPAGQFVANRPSIRGSGFDRQTLPLAPSKHPPPAVRFVTFLLELAGNE